MKSDRMDVFGSRVNFTEYKDEVKETEVLQNCFKGHFKLSDSVEVLNQTGVMPRIKKPRKLHPKPEFYDLPMIEGLPMKGDETKVYHDMRNQCLATNVINNISHYLKFGACIVKFRDNPAWVNFDAFLESFVDLLRKTGRNSTILQIDGEPDCVLVQSRTYTDKLKDSIVEYVRNFIFRSKELNDYRNVTVNLNQIMDSLDQEEFKEVAQACAARHKETDKLVAKLESLRRDILSYTSFKDAIGVEQTLIDAIQIYAYLFYGDDLEGRTLAECIAYLDDKFGACLACTLAYRTGKVIVYALTYINKMLDSVEDFQLWGNK